MYHNNMSASTGRVNRISPSYSSEPSGMVKVPNVGRTRIAEVTIRETEIELERLYSEHYKDPFIMLKVTNRRLIVFRGAGGDAKVIVLANNNTTLLEAIALAGGIEIGKARKIKLIRGDSQNPEVYLIDLSTIEGMKNGDMIIQANDIIYVEPVIKIASTILGELNPVISLASSLILIYAILNPPAK